MNELLSNSRCVTRGKVGVMKKREKSRMKPRYLVRKT